MRTEKGLWALSAVWCLMLAGTEALVRPLSLGAALAVAGLFVFMAASFCLYTRKRLREIRTLSEYLASVYSGRPCMDIRDNREGELSILKNDIYKVTMTLSEQSALLKKDKEYLAETLSNISHQLKTPLTSMYVMTDLLGDPLLPQERREVFLGNLLNQLNRIEWLVSSLLKLSKIDAQAVEFKREPVRLGELFREVLAPLRIPAELKGQTISLDCPEELNVWADRRWTAEALLNIVKNCVEHTGEGGHIRIVCRETPIYTRIRISDDGQGIDQEDLPHIFERFYKGKNAGPDSVGIGLAMSRTILNSQQAELTAESRPGKGTVFQATFYKKVV